MSNTYIIGAGLAGLLAACRFKDAHIYEAGPRIQQHNAVLRFRDESVSGLTGIPFKAVRVDKAIWFDGELYGDCNINLANRYSKKVTGIYAGRSIWNLDSVTRYIAPPDFYDQLVERHNDRIVWNHPIQVIDNSNGMKAVNTAPLPVIMKACGFKDVGFAFDKKSIRVDRYRLPKGSDIYQTIYFPECSLGVFRASITGDVLIVESMIGHDGVGEMAEFVIVCQAFGLSVDSRKIRDCKMDSVEQKYGKIVELPREEREAILYELTRDFNVFSLGRFATWRNILLDDVVKDIGVVERLLAASAYGRERVLANR
jgi:hypothetical protein